MFSTRAFCTGAIFGAGATYFFDPRMGNRRRVAIENQLRRLSRQTAEAIDAGLRDLENRGQGVAQALLRGAVAYARKQGATLIEAYPVDRPARSHDEYMWFGAKSMYDHAGFKEVARRKPQRPIVRLKPGRVARGAGA